MVVRNCRISGSANMIRLGGRNILIEDCEATGPCPYPFRGWLTDEQKRNGVWEKSKLPDARYSAAVFYLYFCDWTQSVPERPENIVIRNCRVKNVHRFLRYNYGGEIWQHQRPIAEITFENCQASGLLLPLAANAQGEGERDVIPFTLRLRDSSFAFARPVDAFAECLNVKCLDFKNVRVSGVPDLPAAASWSGTPELAFENVTGLKREVVSRTGKYNCQFRVSEAEANAAFAK